MSRSRRRRAYPRFDPRDPMYHAPVVQELDLHGPTARDADRSVRAFLDTWCGRAHGSCPDLDEGGDLVRLR